MSTELIAIAQKPLSIPVYIMYAEGYRCKDSEFEAVVEMAEEEQLEPLCAPRDEKMLRLIEESLKRGNNVADIFRSLHSSEILSFRIFWIAGGGSNAFARALLSHLYRSPLEVAVEDYTKKGSILGRHLQWFERHKMLQEELKEKRYI